MTYIVEFNVHAQGEPETVRIAKAASYADAVGQALRLRGGVARTLRYVKATGSSERATAFDRGMNQGHEMAIMDIRCFKVEDE